MHLLQRINQSISNEYGLVFLLCLIMVFPLSYQCWVAFDVSKSIDAKTYWGLAHFDFEQSSVRKYRIILPFFVAGLNWIAVHFIHLFRPDRANGDFCMHLLFYCVNMLCTAAWCTLVYAYLRAFGKSKVASLIGPLIILTSKWTIPLTGQYMVETFYCCFIAMAFLGIATQNARLIFWSIIIGPFAKENFLFMLPVIFLFSNVPKWKSLSWMLLSGILVFTYRYIYDQLTGHPMQESLANDVEHFTFLQSNSERFLEEYWQQDIAATIGIWWLIPLAVVLLTKGFGRQLAVEWRIYMWLWAILVLLQMLMSGDLSRMLYLFLPVYSVLIASAIDHYRNFNSRQLRGS